MAKLTRSRQPLALLVALALAAPACAQPPSAGTDAPASPRDQDRQSRPTTRADATPPPVATFSIVAYDATTGDLGIAVQSRFFGVGAVVPWARAGVGAIATQSFANTTYGPRGLELLASDVSAVATIEQLTAADEQRAQRQVGVVDARGRAATFSGDACLPWAGGITGDGYAVQGNILAGPAVVDAMAVAFETTSGDLATRLATALAAGQSAGGDARGQQSAALLVVREGGGYGGLNDRYIDLRVDDHPAPIRELRRLLDMRHGQLAAAAALQLLREADPTAALESAARATVLAPNDGGSWIALATVRLALEEREGAAAAGREALLRDPWLKTALIRGLLPGGVLEELLAIESFARFWEALPSDTR